MTYQIRFEKIVPSGQAMAHYEGRAWFCLGALPDELCEVEIIRQSKTFVIARLKNIIESSKYRIDKSLANEYSPWSNIDYNHQIQLKQEMLTELFSRPGASLKTDSIVLSPSTDQYRNKLSFALIHENGVYSLGMHVRGTKEAYAVPNGCNLGHPDLNSAALAVLERLNKSEIGDNATGLTVRRSTTTGEVIAILSITKRYKIDFQSLRAPGLAGLVVIADGSFAWVFGASELSENIRGVEVRYPAHEFMQVNIPAFEQVLPDIFALIDAGDSVLDLYGGAGSIGLPVAKAAGATVLSADINAKSVELSKKSATDLGLMNFKATTANADALPDSLFMNVDTVIVDPPRTGLSKELIDQFIKLRIGRIIYLSCDPATQARDVKLLSNVYTASSVKGYDFYPHTPHLESLISLDLITKQLA